MNDDERRLMAGGNSIHDNVVNAQNITLVWILSFDAKTKHTIGMPVFPREHILM